MGALGPDGVVMTRAPLDSLTPLPVVTGGLSAWVVGTDGADSLMLCGWA